jgi:hypothetical protein
VAIELTVKDVEQDGRTIEWRPSMRGKRGVPLTATIHAGEVTRTVTLTVR